VTAYCRALTLKPDIPEGHRLLAIAYRMLGETEKAVSSARNGSGRSRMTR
jgi:hypothetical protein